MSYVIIKNHKKPVGISNPLKNKNIISTIRILSGLRSNVELHWRRTLVHLKQWGTFFKRILLVD